MQGLGVFGTEVLAIELTLPVLTDDGLEWTVAVDAQLIFDGERDKRDVFVV